MLGLLSAQCLSIQWRRRLIMDISSAICCHHPFKSLPNRRRATTVFVFISCSARGLEHVSGHCCPAPSEIMFHPLKPKRKKTRKGKGRKEKYTTFFVHPRSPLHTIQCCYQTRHEALSRDGQGGMWHKNAKVQREKKRATERERRREKEKERRRV